VCGLNTPPTLTEIAARLAAAAEGLGAIAALARVRAGVATLPPELEGPLHAVAEALDVDAALADAPTSALLGVAGMASAFLGEAVALASEPARPPGWRVTDPAVLEGSGLASISFAATLAERFLPLLGDLRARLTAPGAALLDVGVGTAQFSIALCRRLPEIGVVGIDPWRPAFERATANVAAAGMSDRIQLRLQAVEEVTDEEAFDLIWIPLSFIPGAAFEAALPRLADALRPAGYLMVGRFAGQDPLASALSDLRTVRSGGRLYSDVLLRDRLAAAGLTDAIELPRGSLGLMATLAARRGF
jgi:SAM-dependent methyltransferase